MATDRLAALCADFGALRSAVLRREERRRKLGWADHSSGSWDYRVASARAWRISRRVLAGERISLAETMREV